MAITKIILPSRAQPDTVVAIFLLKYLGKDKFSGIENAQIEVWQSLPEGKTEEELFDEGVILIDIGEGRFDHHNKIPKTTASELISEYLEIKEDPSVSKLLEYSRRDDFFGKGTVSEDALDRAFGLSGLIASLNKKYTKNSAKIVEIVMPLLEAHYEEEYRRTKELPEEFENKLKEGKVEIFTVKQNGKNLKCVFIETDSASMAGFLRSQGGGKFDVVILRISSGHTNILTRPTKHVDLRSLAATLREAELMKKGNEIVLSHKALISPGKIPEVLEWYFDPATNSIQNGGVNPTDTKATQLTREEVVQITEVGLEAQLSHYR